MSQRTTYILIAFLCLIPVIVLGTTGIPVLTNVEPDGDITLADGKYVAADEVRARDTGGLGLYEDGGADGLLVRDDGYTHANKGSIFSQNAEILFNAYADGGYKFLDDGYGAVIRLESGNLKFLVNAFGENSSGAGAVFYAGSAFDIDLNTSPGDVTFKSHVHLSDSTRLYAEHIRAIDEDGLGLYEDGGTMGVEISDTGAVTVTELGSGLVKSTSGVLSAAVAGTDYFSPDTDITLVNDHYVAADEMRAVDGDGLSLSEATGLVGVQVLDEGGVDIWLKAIPGSDDTGNGIKTNQIAIDSGAFIAVGDCLHMDSDGEWVASDADAGATMPCQAMAVETGTGYKNVLLKGFIRNDDWNWTPGSPLYASTTTGEITASAPSGSGDLVQIVGFATHADRIFFNPAYQATEVP